jgi:hypothetical protein
MLARRLESLRQEFGKGQQQLLAIEQRRTEVRETLLRISGAIQVLEELIAEQDRSLCESGS